MKTLFRPNRAQSGPTQRRHSRAIAVTAPTLIALLIAGCAAGRGAYNRGMQAELARDYDQALEHYEAALSESPGDIEYQLKVEQARFAAAFEHFEAGRRAMEAGDYQIARAEFLAAGRLDPTNDMARSELERVEDLINSGAPQEPETRSDFEVRKDLARVDPSPELQLSPTIAGPISLRMVQDARAVFETIGELSGINVIFDSDFLSGQLSVDLDNLTVYEALDIVAIQARAFWKPVSQNTVVVAPENQQKRREYESHVLKTLYFTNTTDPVDITEAITAIRTLLNMRFIAQSTSMNAIIVRDTPDKVAIAEKIIDDIDKGRAEVLVEARVLEVDRNRLRELGILPPGGTVFGLDSDVIGSEANEVNVRDLDGINSGSFNIVIPDTVAEFLESDSRTRLVQNPSVRASDGRLASIRIGQRVPVASGSFQPAFVGATGTPVVQFQYIDVGVNMDITPRVLLNRDVSMQVNVQVAATAGTSVISGVALPIFSNRSIEHEIRLREGETNILGGLISQTEITASSGIPGLQDVPLLKHFFSSETRQQDQTEIIVMLTPHIVRMPDVNDRNLRGLFVGTEIDTRVRGLPVPPEEAGTIANLATPVESPRAVQFSGVAPRAGSGSRGVRFDSPMVRVEPGSPTELKLHLNAAEVTAARLTIEFDPDSVALQKVVDGGFFSQDGSPVTVTQSIDNERGRASVWLERPEQADAVSGEGELLVLTLEGLKSGKSMLHISDFTVQEAEVLQRPVRIAEAGITLE